MNKQQQQHQEDDEERRLLLPHLDSPSPSSSSRMIAPVRVARNVAEKQRRDKLNAFIAELANSVPLVASATKRLDKTSILRLAAAFLRLHDSPLNAIGYDLTSKDIVDASASSSDSSSLSSWKPKIFPDHIKSLMEGLEGFVIVVNCDLKLIYVAQTCEKFLGHQNIDMMGFPLTAFIHPGDVDAVRHVMNEARKDVLRSGKKESQRIQIRCRMKERSQPRTEVVTYQMVQIVGSFQFPNSQDFSSISSISSSRLHLVNNNNDVKNMNNNLISSSLSPTSIDNSMDSGLDEASSISSFILSPSPAVIHRSDSTSSGCSSNTSSSLYSSPRFSVKRKFEDLAASETISGISCGTNGKRLATSSSLPPSPALTGNNNNNGTSEALALVKQQQQIVTPTYVAKNLLFKGFVQVIPSSPMAELSLIDANQEEYVTRLSLDGVLLYADHRISTVAGYMPDEVVGRSAYAYILVPDHVISLFAHKLMLSNSNGTGIIVHRLRKRTGEYVYLQSAGCLQYDRSTGQVDHFICVSRLLHEEEGDKERQKFVKRFTPHIASDSPSALYESLQLVIGPKNSRAVKYQSFVSGSSFTSGSATSTLIPEQESSSECLAIESAQMNPMSHRQVESKGTDGTCYPLHSFPAPSTVVSTPTSSPQLLLQPLPQSSPRSIPTIITHHQQQQMLQPTSVQNNNQMENLILTSNRHENQGIGHIIDRTDPTIYVNLPSSASGIMADGSFAETSDIIAVQQQQPSLITQAVSAQQQFLSQPQQVIVDANGIVLGQLSPSVQSQPLLMNQEMNSSVYPDQNLPQDIRSLLQPNQIILDRLRRHANNARYVMSNTSSKSTGDTSVYTMSRVLNHNGSDPMTGAIVFGVNQTDSSMNPSGPSNLQYTIQTNPSLTPLSLMASPVNGMSNCQQQPFEQEAQFQQELRPDLQQQQQQQELQEGQQYSTATVLIRNYSIPHS